MGASLSPRRPATGSRCKPCQAVSLAAARCWPVSSRVASSAASIALSCPGTRRNAGAARVHASGEHTAKLLFVARLLSGVEDLTGGGRKRSAFRRGASPLWPPRAPASHWKRISSRTPSLRERVAWPGCPEDYNDTSDHKDTLDHKDTVDQQRHTGPRRHTRVSFLLSWPAGLTRGRGLHRKPSLWRRGVDVPVCPSFRSSDI